MYIVFTRFPSHLSPYQQVADSDTQHLAYFADRVPMVLDCCVIIQAADSFKL